MAVKTIREYRCDLCGLDVPEHELARLGVRHTSDRPDDCVNVDVGPCCQDQPIAKALVHSGIAFGEGTGSGD